MENFKFKKPVIVLEKSVLEEFNAKFSEIESDTFLTNQYDSDPNEAFSLTNVDMFDISTLRLISRLNKEKARKEKEQFSGEEYDSKIDKYVEFIEWVKENNTLETQLAKVYCPYTHELINTIYLPSVYSMVKSGFTITYDDSECYRKSKKYIYKLKVKDVFKVTLKNDPQEHMSKTAKTVFFAYWGYEHMLDNVTLREAKDANLLEVTETYGTIYYVKSKGTWINVMYFGPKGFYVMMKNKRIYVACPDYPSLQENLTLIGKGELPNFSSNLLPTHNEKIRQAISFGVVDESFAPKEEEEKTSIIRQIKELIHAEEDTQMVYDGIKALMKSEKGK